MQARWCRWPVLGLGRPAFAEPGNMLGLAIVGPEAGLVGPRLRAKLGLAKWAEKWS